MAVICPTVTAENPHQYREQIEQVASFASRIHIDFMDGDFTPNQSPGFGRAWWPHTMQADFHIMYKHPMDSLKQIIDLNPRLVIVHAEAEGNFAEFAATMHKADIKAGVALLSQTKVEVIASSINSIDHVLIFSGSLGQFGGKVDLSLLEKAKQLKKLKPTIEIGWDGGINDKNIAQLAEAGVDVLNVGGYIQRSKKPVEAWAKLNRLVAQ